MRALALVLLAGCRLNFDALPGSDASAGDVQDGNDVDVCALPSTILCQDFTTDPGTASFSGDMQWFASGGHAGGAIQARGVPVVGTGMHFVLPSAITSGSLYARAYVRVEPSSPIQMFLVTIELNNMQATNGQEKVSADVTAGDKFGIGAPYSGGAPASTLQVTRNRWTCVEVGVVVDSTAGEFHLAIDGTPVVTAMGRDTLIPTGFRELILSAVLSASDPATIIDFDDLVIATAPIGC